MSKVGIFMGSFDPPHVGHIGVITAALNSGIVDQVIMIPAWKNLWKSTKTSYIDRFNMCVRSLPEKEETKVSVSNIEQILSSEHPDGVPSYKTIEHFKKLFGDNLYVIMTKETIHDVPSWLFGDKIIMENNFIIVGTLHNSYTSEKYQVVDMPHIEMSSTYIRKELSEDKEVFPYVTEKVRKYINEHNLYK